MDIVLLVIYLVPISLHRVATGPQEKLYSIFGESDITHSECYQSTNLNFTEKRLHPVLQASPLPSTSHMHASGVDNVEHPVLYPQPAVDSDGDVRIGM